MPAAPNLFVFEPFVKLLRRVVKIREDENLAASVVGLESSDQIHAILLGFLDLHLVLLLRHVHADEERRTLDRPDADADHVEGRVAVFPAGEVSSYCNGYTVGCFLLVVKLRVVHIIPVEVCAIQWEVGLLG